MWYLDTVSSMSGQNITIGTNNNSNDTNFRGSQNRESEKKERAYQGREK